MIVEMWFFNDSRSEEINLLALVKLSEQEEGERWPKSTIGEKHLWNKSKTTTCLVVREKVSANSARVRIVSRDLVYLFKIYFWLSFQVYA